MNLQLLVRLIDSARFTGGCYRLRFPYQLGRFVKSLNRNEHVSYFSRALILAFAVPEYDTLTEACELIRGYKQC